MAVRRYWFPAKRFGWGWGPPSTWEGWTVLVAYFALLGAGFAFFPPHERPVAFGIYLAAITAVLIALSWLKGEPPRWRWGGKK